MKPASLALYKTNNEVFMNAPFDQLFTWLKDHKITEVECVVSDLTGIARGKIAPTNKFLHERGMRLPESVLLQTVTGDFVDDDIYYDLLDPADIDMVCKPVADAVYVVPWAIEPTAIVIHDTFDKFGNPIELSPRNVLKKVLQLYTDKGWQPIVAPEMEFYLTQRCEDPDLPLKAPWAARAVPKAVASRSPSMRPTNSTRCSKTSTTGAKLQGLDLDTLIHEDGPAQMEINFRHGDALDLADQITVFKRTLREAALKHNVAATFMAKPIGDEPGSAMHLHQSVVDIATGKPIFADADGKMSELFLHHIGGLQKYIPKAAADVRAQRQLVPPLPAGHLGTGQRRMGRRKPHRRPACADLQPGRDARGKPPAGCRCQPVPGHRRQPVVWLPGHGRTHRTERRRCEGRAYERRNLRLPITIEDALAHMEDCDTVEHYLGDKFVRGYVAVKRAEHENFKRVISSWEREFLLLSV